MHGSVWVVGMDGHALLFSATTNQNDEIDSDVSNNIVYPNQAN